MALSYCLEGLRFKPQLHQLAIVRPLSNALNPVCASGAVQWLTLNSDPSLLTVYVTNKG